MLQINRPYTSEDAHRLEKLSAAISKITTKMGLTTTDVLIGLRYNFQGNNEKWESVVSSATEACVMYDIYHNTDPEDTLKRYGEQNV
jgi:hypothetical protein